MQLLNILSSSLWAVPLVIAVITECIVVIRKSVLRLECHRKLAHMMNTEEHSEPLVSNLTRLYSMNICSNFIKGTY